MRRLLLDSDICIHYLSEADGQVRSRLLAEDPEQVFLCSVVKAELLFGARSSASVERNLTKLDQFCRPFESLPFNDDAARHYSVLRSQLRREGRPIGGNDMMIAAIALAADVTLVTRNLAEFSRVEGLRLERW